MRCRLEEDRRLSLGIYAFYFGLLIVGCFAIPVCGQSSERDWEKAAGGKQEFDVASVREDRGNVPGTSNFPLDGGNVWFTVDKSFKLNPEGSLLSAKNLSLLRYIVFAYKLSGTQELALRFDFYQGLETHVPHWVRGDMNDGERFDIEARAPASVTKDQMRMMMQSLLAERFKLQVHWETQQAPVFDAGGGDAGKAGTANGSESRGR